MTHGGARPVDRQLGFHFCLRIVDMQTIMSGRISKHFPHSKSQGTRSTKEAGRSESKLSRAGSGLQASTGDPLTGLCSSERF